MQSHVRSEINITPLIDIVLVLLIVFIVLVPVLDKGHTPRLPVLGPPATAPSLEPLLLAVAADGGLTLGGQAIAAADLEAGLHHALAQRAPEDRRIVLKVDGEGHFQQAVDLLDRIRVVDPKLPVLLR